MNRFLRFSILSLGVLALSFLAAGVAVAATVATTGGLVMVRIQTEEGPNLHLPVPVALLRVALASAESYGGPELDEARHRLEPWQPSLAAMVRELEQSPSFVLAEVHGEDADVRIAKTGGRLEVTVDAPDANIHISLPIRLARDLVAFAG